MNIDEHPSIAGQLGIQSIPAVIAFKNGQPVDGFMGAIPESQIREFIQKLVGKDGGQPPDRRGACAARQAREAGRLCRRAADIYRRRAAAGARQRRRDRRACRHPVRGGRRRGGAEDVLAGVPADKQDAPAIAAVRAKIELADEAAKLGDPAELERRLAENPRDHQARFDLAMIQNARASAGGGRQSAGHRQGGPRLERRWRARAAAASSSRPGA